MSPFKVHMIHVGNMANKGTQALFVSDIFVIRNVVRGDVAFSVSTTDVEKVKRLSLPLDAVLPQMIDIPYEKVDQLAKAFGFDRNSFTYKAFAVASLIFMFVQAVLSVVSLIFVKIGLKAFYRSRVIESIRNCNLVVSYSDENFKEGASLLPVNAYWILTWWSVLFARTWDVLVAKYLGKPVIMFPNSIGPFRTLVGRFLSRISLNRCDSILIREPVSYRIVEKLGVSSRKVLTSDTALLFTSRVKMAPHGFSGSMVAVCPGVYSHALSEEEIRNYVSRHAEALDISIEKQGFHILLLPHYVRGFRYDDLDMCKLIVNEMRNKDRVEIVNLHSVYDFKSILERMDMVISSKMHPAILAASGFVPILCIAYDHKQTGFFERLGMLGCVIPVRQVSYEKLLSKIDYVWKNRSELEALLRSHIPTLQKNILWAIRSSLSPYVEVKSEEDSLDVWRGDGY